MADMKATPLDYDDLLGTATPKVKILSVKIEGQHQSATELRIECEYCGAKYVALTEISEGNNIPNTDLEGYTANPSEEFVMALHGALDEWEGGKLVATEMERICG